MHDVLSMCTEQLTIPTSVVDYPFRRKNNPSIGTNEVLAGGHRIHTRNVINAGRLGQTCHSYFFWNTENSLLPSSG